MQISHISQPPLGHSSSSYNGRSRGRFLEPGLGAQHIAQGASRGSSRVPEFPSSRGSPAYRMTEIRHTTHEGIPHTVHEEQRDNPTARSNSSNGDIMPEDAHRQGSVHKRHSSQKTGQIPQEYYAVDKEQRTETKIQGPWSYVLRQGQYHRTLKYNEKNISIVRLGQQVLECPHPPGSSTVTVGG